MHGFRLDTSKKLMQELLTGLRPNDSFNILFFSGGSSVLSESSLAVSSDNIRRAIAMLENQQGGGGTRLLPALKRAMAMPVQDGTARSFVIVSDGYVSIETDAFEYIRENLNQANFFTFGIGSSVNRFLMEGLARASRNVHPSADCLRGSGFRLEPQPIRRDNNAKLWGCVLAEREGLRYRVCERIYDRFDQDSWYDVSSWYWASQLNRTHGPWWTVTVAERI